MEKSSIYEAFNEEVEETRELLWRVLEGKGYKKEVDLEKLRADASANIEAGSSTKKIEYHFAVFILLGIAVAAANSGDMKNAIRSLCGASRLLGLCISDEFSNEFDPDKLREDALKEVRRSLASDAAFARLAKDKDGKQGAKIHVQECWRNWQQKPTNYKSKSAFAKDMMSKFEELDSQAVITRWCGQWEKEAAK